jgi:hypothetical protein
VALNHDFAYAERLVRDDERFAANLAADLQHCISFGYDHARLRQIGIGEGQLAEFTARRVLARD